MTNSNNKYKLENKLSACLNAHKIKRLKTGFKNFDKGFGTMAPGIYTIGAPSNFGKTTFCLQLAAQMSEINKVPALYFSCEQGFMQLFSKLVARTQYEQQISTCSNEREISDLEAWASYPQNKKQCINEGIQLVLDKYPQFYIFEREPICEQIPVLDQNTGLQAVDKKTGQLLTKDHETIKNISIPFITDKIKEFINKNKGGVAVVDYFQMLDFGNTTKDKQSVMLEAMRSLSGLALLNNVVLIVISSLSNEYIKLSKNSDDAKIIGSFKGSGDIQYTSDHSFILGPRGDFEDWYKSRKNNENIELTLSCVKSRTGCCGEFDFTFYGKHSYFKEFEKEPFVEPKGPFFQMQPAQPTNPPQQKTLLNNFYS